MTHPAARRFTCRLVADLALVDDLAQEVMVALFSALPTFDPQRDFWPWFRVLSRNTVIDELRHRSRVLEDLVDPANLPEPESDDPDYADRLALAEAIRELPTDMGRAVILHHYSDLTFAEIGEITGISSHTWNSRYRHARSLLRVKLGDWS